MSTVKKCDKCGKIVPLLEGITVRIEKHMCPIEMYDLCYECEKEFRNFMKNKERKNKR